MAFSSGFSFFFCIFCSHSPLGEWSAVQLPAKASDGLSAFDFFLAAQLPATASDGLSSSVFLFISLAFYHVALFHPGKLIFTAFFLQRRDVYDVFA